MPETKRGTKSAEGQTADRKPLPGRIRRAVVEALNGKQDGLTIRQIEGEVGRASPSLTHEPVEESVQGLIEEGLVERAPDSRRLRLSERGRRLVTGMETLAG